MQQYNKESPKRPPATHGIATLALETILACGLSSPSMAYPEIGCRC